MKNVTAYGLIYCLELLERTNGMLNSTALEKVNRNRSEVFIREKSSDLSTDGSLTLFPGHVFLVNVTYNTTVGIIYTRFEINQ